jgi:hypothetical protein
MSNNGQFPINQPIFGAIVVYDGLNAPVTGLVQGDFSFLFSNDGVIVTPVVTFGETGNGRYFFSFTPDALGEWSGLIRNATYNPRGWFEEFYIVSNVPPGAHSSGDSAGAIWWHTNEFGKNLAKYNLSVEEEQKRKMLVIMALIED